jgi:hypothetical protein
MVAFHLGQETGAASSPDNPQPSSDCSGGSLPAALWNHCGQPLKLTERYPLLVELIGKLTDVLGPFWVPNRRKLKFHERRGSVDWAAAWQYQLGPTDQTTRIKAKPDTSVIRFPKALVHFYPLHRAVRYGRFSLVLDQGSSRLWMEVDVAQRAQPLEAVNTRDALG